MKGENISAYVISLTHERGQDKTVYLVFSQTERAYIEQHEWEKYWSYLGVQNGPIDLIGWWRGVQPEILHLAKLALCTLPIPHTGVDVEYSFSYDRMSKLALLCFAR